MAADDFRAHVRPILPRSARRTRSLADRRPVGVPCNELAGQGETNSPGLKPGPDALGREVLLPARVAVRGPPHHLGVTHNWPLFAPFIATRPAHATNPQLGVARMSKPRIARLWFSSTCAVPRQSDEALAKSSAKQINFSRNAGSLISRNAFIKRTPSLGSAASDSRNLLTCSSRLRFIVLDSSFTTDRSEPIAPPSS